MSGPAGKKVQPIVIKRIKKGGHGHHGGAWKVAYADFVTAMMAFFLLMWLINTTDPEQKRGIAEYFAPASVSQTTSGSGGILGGISSGQPVVARVAFKPTSSILTLRRSLNEAGEEIELRTKGRHDPCVGIRAVPVVEAMVACVLADAYLRHRAQTGID